MTNRDATLEPDVHHALNEPATDPDPTEWPDPYDKRPDPRDPAARDPEMDFGDVHTPIGATSSSDPHYQVDPAVDPRKANPHELSRRERRRVTGCGAIPAPERSLRPSGYAAERRRPCSMERGTSSVRYP
jgi:hypothetical protein